MIHTDCYFTASQRPKKNCQDFSICGTSPFPYVILCDGCSSSRDTDLGARILAFSAKTMIKEFLFNDLDMYEKVDAFIQKKFGMMTITRALSAASVLNMNLSCLDSTLTIAFEWNKKVYVLMYGDGDIFSLSKHGKRSITRISYEGNAPYYLSYLLDENRRGLYKEFANQMDGFVKTEFVDGLKKEVKYDWPTIFSYNIEDLYLLLVTSDGSESFIDFNDGSRFPCEEIACEMLNIKSKKGEFIKRRSIRLLEDMTKRNTFNTDDFSVGAIMVEE